MASQGNDVDQVVRSNRRGRFLCRIPFSILLLFLTLTSLGNVVLRVGVADAAGGVITNYPGMCEPAAITAGPDGALWFTNLCSNSIGRITTAGVMSRLHEHRHRVTRRRSPLAPTGRCGSPTRSQLDRADHHRRGGHRLHRAPASTTPDAITAGPDGALWFTNYGNNSIGRITTAGVVTNYTDPGISEPAGIAAGPDGAMWFTNSGNNSIGRITTAGVVTNYTDSEHRRADGDRGRPRRGPVVHQLRQQLDRADHHRRGGHQLHRHQLSDSPSSISCWARRSAVVHQFQQRLDRADHHRRGGHQLHRRRSSMTWGDHRRSGRRPVVHQLRRQLDRADHHRRRGDRLHGHRRSDGPDAIAAGPDGALWFTNYTAAGASNSTFTGTIGRITTGDGIIQLHGTRALLIPSASRPGPDGALWFTNVDGGTSGQGSIGRITTAGAVTNYNGTGIDDPCDHRCGPRRRPVVHQLGQQLDRADHHRRGGHQLHRQPASTTRTGSPPAPTGLCGSPTSPTTRSGGSPPTGAVTNYTGTGIDQPLGITAGPDGALWFTNQGNDSIGRITTTGAVTNYTGVGVDTPAAITAGPDGALWFTNEGNNTIGSITTAGVVSNYTSATIDAPSAITSGPDGALWFTNQGNNSIGRISVGSASGPTITSFTPTSGPVGTGVTIKGTNLSGATKVTFNGTVATITKDTATKIKVKVPSGATTGKITVTTTGGTVTSTSKFKVT